MNEKNSLEKKPRWKRALVYGLFLVCLSLLLYYYREVYFVVRTGWHFCTDEEHLRNFIASFGVFAPLIFIGLQVLQVLFAPIPGELTGFIGGYLFVVVKGLIFSTIGLSVGSLLAFMISRRLGSPFVRRFVGHEIMTKFDYLMEHKGAFFSFLFFIFPGTPKDYFCYLLGLSPMHILTFAFISCVGRIPGTILLTMQGQAIRSEDYRAFFVIVGLALFGLVLTIIYRDRVEKWLKPKRQGRPRRRWGNNKNHQNHNHQK